MGWLKLNLAEAEPEKIANSEQELLPLKPAVNDHTWGSIL